MSDAPGVPNFEVALDAVEACDVDRMLSLLVTLTPSPEEIQRILAGGVDDSGHQLLHIAAMKGTEDAAADMVRLLLEYGAPPSAADFAGETPLSLAVDASLEDVSAWAALDTVRVLLVAGASVELPDTLLLQLRERAQAGELGELGRLLEAFGVDIDKKEKETAEMGHSEKGEEDKEQGESNQDRETKEKVLEEQCKEECIPLEKLGSLGAKAVWASCTKWREMNVKQLRAECAELGIPTDGCVEKSEIIEHLRPSSMFQCLGRGVKIHNQKRNPY